MAHAARLIQRMQKELRLLLADPPPGASFPFLSTDADAPSSFSTIHALIEGPVGTVYANGAFKITIQIPERYPFQPPSITFATPIYHPNIDNGGRICLDILNLPPKGAWKPSLNISTVLTSIGLLLSEPNPDDGLMCEVSREYKYDRQAFNEKARSMTEKHAKPGADMNNHGSSQVAQSSFSPSNQAEGSSNEVNGQVLNHKKRYGISKKLSLEFSCPNSRMNEHGGKVQGGGPNESLEGGGKAEEPARESELDAIVVLDSEDSEGEEGMDGLVSRSKLLVARRAAAGKRKQLPH